MVTFLPNFNTMALWEVGDWDVPRLVRLTPFRPLKIILLRSEYLTFLFLSFVTYASNFRLMAIFEVEELVMSQ